MTAQSNLRSDPLGALVSRHQPVRLRLTRFKYVAVAIGLFGLGMCVVFAVAALNRRSWTVLMGGIAVGGSVMVGAWRMNRDRKGGASVTVNVCEHGFRMTGRDQGVRELRWAEVTRLLVDAALHVSGRGQWNIDFTLEDGAHLHVQVPVLWISDPLRLLAHIINNTAPVVIGQARRAHRRGITVHFGPIAVTSDGVRSGNQRRSWNEVGTFGVSDGYLSGEVDGTWWFRERVKDVPNLAAFLDLVGGQSSPPPTPADWVWTWGE